MAKKKKQEESTALAVVDPTRFAVTVPEAQNDLITLLAGGVGVFDMTRMKVPASGGQVWALDTLEGLTHVESVECVVILLQGNQKAWWRHPYGSGGSGAPPDCSSTNSRIGIGNNSLEEPGDGEEDPQGEHSCIECPWSRWKTAKKPDGSHGRGKSCKDWAMIFLYREDSGTPTMLSVPPSSLASMRKYSVKLLDAKKQLTSVLTRIGLKPEKNSDGTEYSEITFEYAGDLPEEAATEVASASALMADFLATHTVTAKASDLHGETD